MKKLRYYSYNEYLRELFGVRVQKIPVDAGFTCPNRDNTLSTGGCIYCGYTGSASPVIDKNLSVQKQIEKGMEWAKKRYNAKKFIIYFQAFTNTFASLETLEKLYSIVYKYPEVVGISIGTRPDVVPDDVLKIISKFTEKYLVWIEYGLQSIHYKTLKLINRGHTLPEFLDAVYRTRKIDERIKICTHIIVGLPQEGKEEILETAKSVSALRLDGIKIHSMYVEKGTVLEQWYKEGKYTPISLDFYVDTVVDILEILPPNMVIQRLTGETTKDFLIAPEWVLDKATVLQKINEELEKRDTYQGKKFGFGIPVEILNTKKIRNKIEDN